MIPASRERAHLADDIGLCSAVRNVAVGAAACGSTASGLLPDHPSTDGPGTVGPMRSGSLTDTVKPIPIRERNYRAQIRNRLLVVCVK